MLYTVAARQLLILGMPIPLFSLVAFIAFVVGFYLWWYRRREKKRSHHQKITTDHILAAIKTKSDHVIFRKCRLYKGEVRDFTPTGSRIKFQTDKYITKDNDANASEKYFAVPGFGKDVWYPIGLEKIDEHNNIIPDSTQVQIKMWTYNEGQMWPEWPNDPGHWKPGEVRDITTAMAQEANDEVVMAVINKNFQTMLKDIESFVGLLKRIPFIFYGICGAVLLELASLYFLWQIMGKVTLIIGK